MEELTLPSDSIRNCIYEVRGVKVMLDSDLAAMYEVETKYLKRQVNRNIDRFPPDFMFQLTKQEWEFLRCQFVTSKIKTEKKDGRGGTRYLPYAFTEQGVAMISSVLGNDKAIQVNIKIMRAFVAVRQALPRLATREDIDDLKSRVQALEGSVSSLATDNFDLHAEIGNIYQALDLLQQQPDEPIPPVGYQATLDRENNKKK